MNETTNWLDEITKWISLNKEWIFSGVGVTVILGIAGYLLKIFSKPEPSLAPSIVEKQRVDKEEDISKARKKETNRIELIDSLKPKTKILFIDDIKEYNVVGILQTAGWKNVEMLQDVDNIDSLKVREANIFFIDINGVGKILKCEGEGLGLAQIIKERYPNKKVVIYSAGKGNMYHPVISMADHILKKNAPPTQFQRLIEKYSIEIFSHDTLPNN